MNCLASIIYFSAWVFSSLPGVIWSGREAVEINQSHFHNGIHRFQCIWNDLEDWQVSVL